MIVGLAVVEDHRGIEIVLRCAYFASSKQCEYLLPACFVALVDFLVGTFGVGEAVPIVLIFPEKDCETWIVREVALRRGVGRVNSASND